MSKKIIIAIGMILTTIASVVALFTDSTFIDKVVLTWDAIAPAALAVLQIWGVEKLEKPA